MPIGWLASILVHACVALLLYFGFPLFFSSREAVRGEVVPIEIVTLSDVTDVSPIAPMEEEVVSANEAPPEEIEDEEPEPAPEPEQKQRSLASFLDDVTKGRPTPRPNKGPRGENPREGVGRSAGETATLEARIIAVTRDHLLRNRCWRSTADMAHPDSLDVVIRFRLDARGRVVGRPVPNKSPVGNPELRVAIQRAETAVLQCDPYPFPNDPALRDHYDLWRELEFNFSLRQLG